MKLLRLLKIIFPVLIVLIVFKSWFGSGLISSGDFWSSFKSMYANRPLMLYAWDWEGGLGRFVSPILAIYLGFGIPTTFLGKILGLNWNIVERVYYLFPFILLSIFSSFYLFQKLFINKNFAILSSAIFILNTYILLIAGGGQVAGIGLAYSILPIILYFSIKVLNNCSILTSIVLGLLLALQLLFDVRVAYLVIFSIFIYWAISILEKKNFAYSLRSFVFIFLIPGVICVLCHAFWIIPAIVNHRNPVEQLGAAYSTVNAVQYFSFAKFENTIALLHPNWPENIFGKVEFMRPEFLLLPILAFSSLFFLKNEKKERRLLILFFALLAIVGAFLAKGSNDPFGGIYLWMFSHVPGFMMFRDPTKWYLLIAISYSMLIPFTVWKIYEWLKSRNKFSIFNLQNLFFLLLISYLLFIIRPALLGKLTGTFTTTQVPKEYIKLENFLESQNNYSRTLWVPSLQRFGLFTSTHPSISAQDFFNEYENVKLLQKIDHSRSLLQLAGVKYVIVPYDSQGEIFIKDRKYDNLSYLNMADKLSNLSWLKEVSGFGRIFVFELTGYKEHFWSLDENMSISYEFISPVEYVVKIKNAKTNDLLVFSEAYDSGWIAKSENFKDLNSNPYDKLFNSFVLEKEGSYTLDVYYEPQKWVNYGMWVSGLSLLIVLGVIYYFYVKT